jgi:C-5 cytosine-specific DNA methylase
MSEQNADYVRPKPRLLDLFCCAGGAAMGYHRAGFEVVGVDIDPQPNYPFEFHQADAIAYPLDGFDVIHASPPCQSYSDLAKRNGNGHEWPRLVTPTRERLVEWGGPYVIENVDPCEDLIDPIRLCGTMFPGLRVIRHRLFESNVPLEAPPHPKHPLVFTHDKRKAHYGKLDQNTSFVQVTGGGNATIANKRAAMGCWWMNNHELNEAIPPAFSEWIGTLLLAARMRELLPGMEDVA